MDEYQSLVNDASKDKLVVIDFTAKWCGPCRHISPVFEKLAQENTDVSFAKVDVDETQEVTAKFHVSSMPTFIFSKGGVEIERFSGANSEKLTNLVAELRAPGVNTSREKLMENFCNACLAGDKDAVINLLDQHPDMATRPVPEEWHYLHIRRGGWQPVDARMNPGVMNAANTTFLISSAPAYALHLAAGNGHGSIVQALIKAGANLETADGDGDTALTWATWCGRRDVMEQLLAAGADPSFADGLSVAQFEGIQGDGASLQYLKDTNRRLKKPVCQQVD